jgi:hypothetical protein
MAGTSPEVSVTVRTVPPLKPRIVNPAMGQKLPDFKAAARNRGDRNYVPRYDIIMAGEE